jgi:flavorubredoxin
MNTNIDEIAPDVYRISTFVPDYHIEFNQFLIKDEQPFLMHTGLRKMFEITRAAVAQLIDPAQLRWIGYSHFEPDECGALNEWLAVAPNAQALCSVVGGIVMMNDYAARPARSLNDNEVVEIGTRRLRFLATPHVPHAWDAGLFFEETDRTLLCSDLFFHPQSDAPLIETDIVGRARDSILFGMQSPLAKDMPYTPYTDRTMERLADLAAHTLALMHGSSFRGDGRKALEELAVVIRETHGRNEGSGQAAG